MRTLIYFVFFLLLLIPITGQSQSETELSRRLDSLITETKNNQTKSDSLLKTIDYKYSKFGEDRNREIVRVERKNFILSIVLVVSIIVITLVQ